MECESEVCGVGVRCEEGRGDETECLNSHAMNLVSHAAVGVAYSEMLQPASTAPVLQLNDIH